MLRATRTVIVDELHALAPNKRGSHLALSLERLAALCGDRLLRIGLSATQKPIDTVARFLVGTGAEGAPPPDCTIVDIWEFLRSIQAIAVSPWPSRSQATPATS